MRPVRCGSGQYRWLMNAVAQVRRVSRRVLARRESAGVWLPIGVVLAVLLAGAIQRWWVAAHPIGTLTSDGAVIGLMALRLLHHGQLTAYMWGQSYGGSLEAVLTAAVFAVAGTGTSQLLAATALSSALCALALWRAGRRTPWTVVTRTSRQPPLAGCSGALAEGNSDDYHICHDDDADHRVLAAGR